MVDFLDAFRGLSRYSQKPKGTGSILPPIVIAAQYDHQRLAG